MRRMLLAAILGALLVTGQAFAPDKPAIGGVRAGMTLQQVFAAKGRHCKVMEDPAGGLTTLLYDDVAVLVKGYRAVKQDVVDCDPPTAEQKEKAKDLPYADDGENSLMTMRYRTPPEERAPSLRTREDCEKILREHADDKPLCAWALMGIARLAEKDDRMDAAVKAYQQAADDYGGELVPFINTRMRVKESALMHVAGLHEKMGKPGEALAIYRAQMNDGWDFNTRTGARIKFLALSQAHLKVEAKVSLAKTTFATGEAIPVTVVLRNDTAEDIVLEAFVSVRRAKGGSYGFIEAIEKDEWTIPAHSTVEKKLTLPERSTRALEPNAWRAECTSGRVPITSNTVDFEVVPR